MTAHLPHPPDTTTPSSVRGPATAATPQRPGERDHALDNAKFLAILLVVCGHAWEPLRADSRVAMALYSTVYAFHMPAFVMLSGYFSRHFDAAPHRVRRLITGVAVPYVLFETAYSLFHRWLGDAPEHRLSLLDPFYLTWFLMALFVWRLSAPLWRELRHPLPIALAIAALATVSPAIGDDLDLQRVQQFLPYFVLGMLLEPRHLALVRHRAVRLLAVPVLAGALTLAYWLAPRVDTGWLYHRDSAQELGHSPATGVLVTLLLFGCSTALTLAFLALAPQRRTWCSTLGSGTLYAYLCHGFLLKGAEYAGWYEADWLRSPVGLAGLTLLAVAVGTLLCTPPVRHALRFAVEPRMSWAFTDRKHHHAPRRDGAGR